MRHTGLSCGGVVPNKPGIPTPSRHLPRSPLDSLGETALPCPGEPARLRASPGGAPPRARRARGAARARPIRPPPAAKQSTGVHFRTPHVLMIGLQLLSQTLQARVHRALRCLLYSLSRCHGHGPGVATLPTPQQNMALTPPCGRAWPRAARHRHCCYRYPRQSQGTQEARACARLEEARSAG